MAAVGTATYGTPYSYFNYLGERIHVFTWTCTTSSGTGAVSGQTGKTVKGELLQLQAIPDTDDTPSAGYDVTFVTAAGVDVLCGAGADLTTTGDIKGIRSSTGVTNEGAPVYLYKESISPVIAAGGNSKVTVLKLFVKT